MRKKSMDDSTTRYREKVKVIAKKCLPIRPPSHFAMTCAIASIVLPELQYMFWILALLAIAGWFFIRNATVEVDIFKE